MKFNPDNPGYAITYPDGQFAFVYRQAQPAEPVPKLLIFTGRQQAESYQYPGAVVSKPLCQWHRVAIQNNVSICLRAGAVDYELPPRAGWDFTGKADEVSRVAGPGIR